MNDIKKSFKMLKFCLKPKTTWTFIIIFTLIGLAFEVFSCMIKPDFFYGPMGGPTLSFPLGALFILLLPMYFVQMQYGLGLFGYVRSSGFSKKMFWDANNIVYSVCSFIVFSIVVLNRYILVQNHPEYMSAAKVAIMEAAFMSLIFTVYSGVVYKYYVVSVILFFLIYFPVYFSLVDIGIGFNLNSLLEKIRALSFGEAALYGYLMVAGSLILYMILARVFYRAPISRLVFRSYLKKK